MIAATTIFFPPDWPRAAARRLGVDRRRAPGTVDAAGVDRAAVESAPTEHASTAPASTAPRRASMVLVVFLAAWIAIQVIVPLRHVAVAGSPSWTEEGHRFSWHMRLRDKTGTATFAVTTADGATFTVDPYDVLTAEQAGKLAGDPQRLVQFAHHLAAQHGGAEVRATTSVSLNGRPAQPIVDPTVDLASVPTFWWGHADWIVPLAPR
jgi:hypothetical protein